MPSDNTLSKVYRLNPVVAIEDFGERSLALNCENLNIVELNATACGLLRCLDGKRSLAQVAAAIAEDYDQLFEMVLTDVQETIVQMIELDLVVTDNHTESQKDGVIDSQSFEV